MWQAVGAIIFVLLAYIVLELAVQRIPLEWARAMVFLVPLIGLAAAVWLFAPRR